MKSLHPAATQKPHPQPRAHSKSRLLLLCTSRSNGYPRRGLGYCRERGSCGEACGAPKGGFNCLEGRERKPRHPLPGASARPRAGKRGVPLVFRAVSAHGKGGPSHGPARVHPAGAGVQGDPEAPRHGGGPHCPSHRGTSTHFDGQDLPVFLGRAPALHIPQGTPLFSWVGRPHCTFPRGRQPARWAWFTIPVSRRAGSHPGLQCAASLTTQRP